jgi:predicted metal-dependent phosphoesterase TrpH
VYAPHFTRWPDIRDRARAFSDEDLLVIPGRELFTGSWRSRKHVLALGLEAPIPDFLTLAATMAELERQDATVLAPHPSFLTVSLDAADLREYRDQLAGVEVYNPKHLPWHNDRARRLARTVDRPAFGSSYAHRRATVGEVWTAFPASLSSETELLAAFADRHDRRVERRDGPVHRRRCLAEFAHLGYENTWEKFDRVVLSGREATHPHNPAYADRYTQASVY